MKNFYLLLFLCFFISAKSQTNCEDANSYLVSAYSHVKTSYNSYNKSDLQYYANRSLEALKLSKTSIKDCNCEKTLELIDKGLEVLAKVDHVKTYEDGRFYIKRAREICKQSVIEIDKCSVETSSNNNDDELSTLQAQQLELKKQQEVLKLQEKKIKLKLEQQQKKALQIEKETVIASFQKHITAHIETYNATLKDCGCSQELINPNSSIENTNTSSIKDLKKTYITHLKSLTSRYTEILKTCKP